MTSTIITKLLCPFCGGSCSNVTIDPGNRDHFKIGDILFGSDGPGSLEDGISPGGSGDHFGMAVCENSFDPRREGDDEKFRRAGWRAEDFKWFRAEDRLKWGCPGILWPTVEIDNGRIERVYFPANYVENWVAEFNRRVERAVDISKEGPPKGEKFRTPWY